MTDSAELFEDPETRFKYDLARELITSYVAVREALKMLDILRTERNLLGAQTASTFRFRWNKQVADDHRIERLHWTD